MLFACSAAQKRRRKKLAFTIAEVVIVLGIVGIIANLTLPSLFAKTEEMERIVKFKKMYTEMAAVAALVAKDNGGSIVGAYTYTNYGTEIPAIRNLFKPYFKDATDCHGATCKPTDNALQRYKYKSKTSYTFDMGNGIEGFILPDGSSYTFGGTSPECKGNWNGSATLCSSIYIDLNGPEKGPNALGWDFYCVYLGDGYLVPVIPAVGYNDCTTHGWGCSGYILQGH